MDQDELIIRRHGIMTTLKCALIVLFALILPACAHRGYKRHEYPTSLSFRIQPSGLVLPVYVRVTVLSAAPVCNDIFIDWGDGTSGRSDECATLAMTWYAEHVYHQAGEYSPQISVNGELAQCSSGCLVQVKCPKCQFLETDSSS